MMKIFLVIGYAVLMTSSSQAQAKKQPQKKKWITISGKVNFLNPPDWIKRAGYNTNRVVVGKGTGRKFVAVDSAYVKPDGTYSLKLDATVPSFYNLDFLRSERIEVFADDNMVINVRGFDTAKIRYAVPTYIYIQSNSINNKILNILYNNDYWGYFQMMADAQQQYYADKNKEIDSTWIAYLKKEKAGGRMALDKTDRMVGILLKDFPDKPATVKLIARTGWRKDTTEAMALLNNLIKKYPWLEEAKKLKEDINTYVVRSGMLENGKPAPLVSYPDPRGKLIDLASYKGKYVLIDFWASWCGPCRKSLPRVKEQYALYKDKGFDVFSVSIDENKKAWEKAIEEEKMPWNQVLSPDMDKTMKEFLFSGIPTLYLIDPKGNIVEKYTGYSDELEDKLKQIFDKAAATK